MPRTKEENEKVKQARKARLIATALEMLAEVGYKKTSMNEIASRAEASHGLIYHYYEDKASLLREIARLAQNWKHIDVGFASRVGSLDGIMVFISFFKEEKLNENEINLALFQLNRGLYPREEDVDATLGRTPFKAFAAMLEGAAREEVVPYGNYAEKTEAAFDYLRGYLQRRLIALKRKEKDAPAFNQSSFNKLISY